MDQQIAIFNIHDFVLLLTSSLCLLFALLAWSLKGQNKSSQYLLIAMMVAFSLLPLHKLILFGVYVRQWAIHTNLNLFFTFSIAYWLEAQLLYLYTLSFLSRDFKITNKHLLHAIPAVAFAVYLYIAYLRFDDEYKFYLIDSFSYFTSSHYVVSFILQSVIAIIYLIACLVNIKKHRLVLLANFSNISDTDVKWLLVLIIGYLTVRLARITSFLSGAALEIPEIGNALGLITVYVEFALICLIIYCSFRYFPAMNKIDVHFEEKHVDPNVDSHSEHAEKLREYMKNEKPYRDPDITLKQLARQTNFSSRTLSSLINRHFHENFFEFINNYRIEEAKQLLSDDTGTKRTITDIYLDVGFNNRAVFNSAFKRLVGKTPSQFRREISVQ